MKILFVGAASWINDWAAHCPKHKHYGYVTVDDMDLVRSVTDVRDDIGKAKYDLIIDVDIDPAALKLNVLLPIVAHLPSTPLLSNTIGCYVCDLASEMPAEQAVAGFSYLPGYFESDLFEVCVPFGNPDPWPEVFDKFFASIGRRIVFVEDVPGHVFGRILLTIINEAFWAAQAGVASLEEIDQAMKLGVNYPKGPTEWGVRIGLFTVNYLLSLLLQAHGDPRLRPCPMLHRVASYMPVTAPE